MPSKHRPSPDPEKIRERMIERAALREQLKPCIQQLRAILEAADGALDGPDPEAALVFLGMLSTRALGHVFPT